MLIIFHLPSLRQAPLASLSTRLTAPTTHSPPLQITYSAQSPSLSLSLWTMSLILLHPLPPLPHHLHHLSSPSSLLLVSHGSSTTSSSTSLPIKTSYSQRLVAASTPSVHSLPPTSTLPLLSLPLPSMSSLTLPSSTVPSPPLLISQMHSLQLHVLLNAMFQSSRTAQPSTLHPRILSLSSSTLLLLLLSSLPLYVC